MNVYFLTVFLLGVTSAVTAETREGTLFKTFDEVKGALLAGQHLSAWVQFAGCKLLAETPIDVSSAEELNKHQSNVLPTDDLPMKTWTQKYHTWQWMAPIENQEVFWFPSHQALGGGEFASERVLLWQNGTLLLDVVMFGTSKDHMNVTQVALNCTLGTSALFRGWSDLKKPVDTPAHAIAANAQQGIELSVVIEYFNCTRVDGEEEANPPMIKAIGGHALSDAITGSMDGMDFYTGAYSFIERTPDKTERAFGDDVYILSNGTVYVDTFMDFFLKDYVVHRDYYAECDFGKNALFFA